MSEELWWFLAAVALVVWYVVAGVVIRKAYLREYPNQTFNHAMFPTVVWIGSPLFAIAVMPMFVLMGIGWLLFMPRKPVA